MKFLFVMILGLALVSCRNSKTDASDASSERYKFAPELAEAGKKDHAYYWQKSKDWIEINNETGDFKGSFRQVDFSGNFVIKKVSSGFTKGFYYSVELGYLEKDVTDSKQAEAFFSHLSGVKRLYYYPDNLNNPVWLTLEISSGKDEGILKFILKKV